MRAPFLCIAGILAFLASPAFADCQLRQEASFPLLAGQTALISVPINGKPVPMVVATGADDTSVTPGTAASLGLMRDTKRRTWVRTAGGQDLVENVVIGNLGLTRFGFLGLSVPMEPLAGVTRGAPPVAGGLIGVDLLHDFAVDVDFPERKLTLYRALDCDSVRPLWQGAYQTVTAKLSSTHAFLIAIALNGHPLTALLDTGSATTIISEAAAESAGVSGAQLDKDRTGSIGTVGAHRVSVAAQRFDSIEIGSETQRNVTLAVEDIDPKGYDAWIGADYFRSRRVFLAYPTGAVFVQRRPVAFSPGTTGAPPPATGKGCRIPPEIVAAVGHSRLTVLAVLAPPALVPDKVKADHIVACAAALFHVTPDGAPVDVKVVTEWPAGYGLGDAVLRAVAAKKYKAPASPSDWYFAFFQFRP